MTLHHPGHSIMTDSKEDGLRAALHQIVTVLEEIGPTPTHDAYGDRRRLTIGTVKAVNIARDALSASPPPVGGSGEEPVAWVVGRVDRGGTMIMCLPLLRGREEMERYQKNNPDETLIPLYAAPVPNGVPEGWTSAAIQTVFDEVEDRIDAAPTDGINAEGDFNISVKYQQACFVDGMRAGRLATINAFKRLAASPVTPEGLSGGGWQDISTAPKDGTWIEAWRPMETFGTMAPLVHVRWQAFESVWVWPDDTYEVFTERGRDDSDRMIERGDNFQDTKFTHWRPLPTPPIPRETPGFAGIS